VRRAGVIGHHHAGQLQQGVVDAQRHAIQRQRVGVEVACALHLGRAWHDDDPVARGLGAAHKVGEGRPAAVQELHAPVGERADQHIAPGLDAVLGQQHAGRLPLCVADLHADVLRRLGLHAEEVAGQLPILHQRVPALAAGQRPLEQPGAPVARMAGRLEARQARIQRRREGIGEEQHVGPRIELRVELAGLAPHHAQLPDAVVQVGLAHMHRPALGLQQAARPALAEQLQLVAVALQQAQCRNAQDRVPHEVAQADDEGAGFYHLQVFTSGAGFCTPFHDLTALIY